MTLYSLFFSALFPEVGVAQGSGGLIFPTLADVREYAAQEGYEPMDVDFEQMTDEEFQQILDRSRI